MVQEENKAFQEENALLKSKVEILKSDQRNTTESQSRFCVPIPSIQSLDSTLTTNLGQRPAVTRMPTKKKIHQRSTTTTTGVDGSITGVTSVPDRSIPMPCAQEGQLRTSGPIPPSVLISNAPIVPSAGQAVTITLEEMIKKWFQGSLKAWRL
uniref:Uncharacterized protein n=1 Tax=Cannabis sativa TaxID=3483 RepID=A0A803P0L0_CANSA